ncbi:hypothetical protein RT97_10695 [Variovorax paradoxus]|uniref:DUF6708 domain-containing protein n=2 Tax=Variovorax paradoxus TaxID=34073 RepID=A0A0D0MWE8_VARPD|nr:hypothetical protein RT97_10695 [Variovorax paradoxus]
MSRENNPDYDIRLPQWNAPDPQFEFVEKVQKKTLLEGKAPWRIASREKRELVHGKASSCDSLLGIHSNAIVVGAPAGTTEITFMMGLYAVLIGLAACMFGWGAFESILELDSSRSDYVLNLSMSTVSTSAALFFLVAAIFFFRVGFLTPRDLPVLFNRKTREVSFFTVIPLRFWKIWQRAGVGEVKTYRWDDAYARSYQLTEMTGEAARSTYLLALLWSDPGRPRHCKEIVTIGYKGWWEDELLWRLYEHIRRYMEEGGPPIQPGESLRHSGTGKLPQFPPEVIAAAGGPAFSEEEVRRLASIREWQTPAR